MLNFWLHMVINILSTSLLGASNYSMQCLSAPTRRDIDKAHSKRTWLDIGIPSYRNLAGISRLRLGLWCLLALSSIPLHLFYNSAVFSTLFTQEYGVYVVTNNFDDFVIPASATTAAPLKTTTAQYQALHGGSVVSTTVTRTFTDTSVPIATPLPQDIRTKTPTYERLNKQACLQAYASPFVSDRSTVLLVSSRVANQSDAATLLLSLGYTDSGDGVSQIEGYDWICPSRATTCDLNQAASDQSSWVFKKYDVQYCLSEKIQGQCKLQFSLPLMIVVIIFNFIKMVCMALIAWRQKEEEEVDEPLVTIGDAISSFLDSPDPYTAGSCIGGKARFHHHGDSRLEIRDNEKASSLFASDNCSETMGWDRQPRIWQAVRHRWHKSATQDRWFMSNVL